MARFPFLTWNAITSHREESPSAAFAGASKLTEASVPHSAPSDGTKLGVTRQDQPARSDFATSWIGGSPGPGAATWNPNRENPVSKPSSETLSEESRSCGE